MSLSFDILYWEWTRAEHTPRLLIITLIYMQVATRKKNRNFTIFINTILLWHVKRDEWEKEKRITKWKWSVSWRLHTTVSCGHDSEKLQLSASPCIYMYAHIQSEIVPWIGTWQYNNQQTWSGSNSSNKLTS